MKKLCYPSFVCLAVACAGCGRTETPALVQPVTPVKLDAPASKPAAATSQPAGSSTQARPAPASAAEFKPPFPKRENPFQRPDFTRITAGKKATGNSLHAAHDIQLKGFVNVGGIQALLWFDGKITPVKEGDQIHGTQVIKVDPPRVILQRDRTRWTEALYAPRSAPPVDASEATVTAGSEDTAERDGQ